VINVVVAIRGDVVGDGEVHAELLGGGEELGMRQGQRE
jgi:hypothetical protein